MKHSKAVEYLRAVMNCVQKLRSNTAEAIDIYDLGSVGKELMQEQYPFVYDEQKTILKPLLKLIERVDNGGQVTPQEFYNIMYVIFRFADIVEIQYIMTYENVHGFPKPDLQWLRGWEKES